MHGSRVGAYVLNVFRSPVLYEHHLMLTAETLRQLSLHSDAPLFTNHLSWVVFVLLIFWSEEKVLWSPEIRVTVTCLSGVGSQVTQKLFSIQVILLTGYVRVFCCSLSLSSYSAKRTHSFTVDACLYFALFMLLQTLKKKILCRLIVRTAISQYSYSLHLKWKRLVSLNSANVCVSHN